MATHTILTLYNNSKVTIPSTKPGTTSTKILATKQYMHRDTPVSPQLRSSNSNSLHSTINTQPQTQTWYHDNSKEDSNEAARLEKMHKILGHPSIQRTREVIKTGERIAVDINGPLPVTSRRNNRYVLTFIDYATRYAVSYPMERKSQTKSKSGVTQGHQEKHKLATAK
eukprot:m.121229 g.121229  ORF g.121229 m.121229 type:complete len:169 (+) comp9375_c0_seq66:640-1146(+)